MAVSFTLLDLQHILAQIVMGETNTPPDNPSLAFGIRQVAGTNNNTVPGNELFGASDQPFSNPTQQYFQTVTVNVDGTVFDPNPGIDGDTMTTTYAQNLTNTNNPIPGIVVDTQPRTISNIISDISSANPAAVQTAQEFGAQLGDGYTVMITNPQGLMLAGADGVFGTPDDPVVGDPNNLFIGNITPDAGLSAPFNSWMTFFGQFFDHGLDLITKGGQGTVFIPLLPDDPLYNPEPGSPNFMALTRATTTLITGGADGIIGDNLATANINEGADDVHKFINQITPFVDQNQTYSSHPSHQVFLREYTIGADLQIHSTGKLLQHAEGPDGILVDNPLTAVDESADNNTGMATWADLKANALKLGIILLDTDVGNIPQLVTDAYGNFLRGPLHGGVQVVTAHGTVEMDPGTPAVLPPDTVRIGVAFINDMAGAASPFDHNGLPLTADADNVAGNVLAAGEYDDELLDAHYVAGDGRVNENIALTTVHEIFHSEHNRLIDHIKSVVQTALNEGNVSAALDWVLPGTVLTPGTNIADGAWNGERLFQAAKFGTETQYQHLVFEEFARKVAPAIHLFGNNDIHLDPAIMSEFANAVYRFGHSMLDENVPLFELNADGTMKIDNRQTVDAHVNVPVVSAFAILGTPDDDSPLVGDPFGDNQFVGGAGNDDIIGGTGSDTYFFNSATDGTFETITEAGSFDRIVLTGTERASDIRLYADGTDLHIHLNTTGAEILVANFLGGGDSLVEQLIFSDGTYIDFTDLNLQQQIILSSSLNMVAPGAAQVANANFGQAIMTDMGLIEAFTNPLAYANLGATGAAEIVQGNTHQIGSEIDEFVTGSLRNNLLGLPLDLAALNIARGRDTGVAPLNLVRAQIFAATNDQTLRPYANWAEFGQFLKHQASLINFIAAYGTHAALTAAPSITDKRDVAINLITLGTDGANATAAVGSEARDAWDYMHSLGAYANDVNNPLAVHAQWSTGSVTGVDNVDLWIGGLAEKQNLFGGLLGSTFNFIFETQLENLQDGDRLYYLPRIEGMDFAQQIENNSFASMIMTNTGAKHLPAAIFLTPEYTVEASAYFRTDIANFDSNLFHVDAQGFVVNNATGVRVATDQSNWLRNPVTGALLVEVLPDGTVHFIGDDNFFGNTIVIGGTEGNDRLQSGHADDDTVWGDGGNDWIDGGNGNDNLYGGTGNDTIVDSAGFDIIHGDEGNDSIFGGTGDDIIFGNDGDDYIETGPADLGDEGQGGAGNDIIIGGDGDDTLIGQEGDDWIEGGGGGDGLIGDTGAPTGQVPLYAANDVLDGGANGDKMTGFSGDDIMLGEGGFDKFLGRLGFDWADFEKETQGVHIDMERRIFIPNQQTLAGDAVRDFFIETEATSGSKFNDFIDGTEDAGGAASVFNELLNLNLITNLDTFFANGVAANFGPLPVGTLARNPVGYNEGNILLGGDGSDVITGRAGNDIIDGDAWLHVSLSNRAAGGTITREILFDTTPGDIDTAVFRDVMANYTINLTPDAEGFITVSHNSNAAVLVGGLARNDGFDKIRNVERLQFLDQTIVIDPAPNANRAPTGQLVITDDDNNPATPVAARVNLPLTIDFANSNVADPDGIQANTIVYTWQYQAITPGGGTQWVNIPGASGPLAFSAVPTFAQLGFPIRVVESFIDNRGVAESIASLPTALVLADPNINTAPFINQQANPVGLPDTTANTTTPVSINLPVLVVFNDHETLPQNLIYTAVMGDTGVAITSIPNQFGNTHGLTFNVQFDLAGNVTGATITGNATTIESIPIRVIATDPGGLSVSDTFLINVLQGNVGPQASPLAETFSGNEDGIAAGVLLAGTDGDAGPQPLAYQIIAGSEVNGSVIFDPNTRAYTFTPSPDISSDDIWLGVPTTFSFQYRVTDGLSFSAPKTVTGTIHAVDDGVADVTITGTAAAGGTLSAVIGIDPDGPWIAGSDSYQWYRDGIAINGATGIDLLLGAGDVGHQFTVAASYTDGQGFSYSGANAVMSSNAADVGVISTTGIIGGGAPPKIQLLNTITDPDGGIQPDTITVQWERSTDNVNWTPIDSVNNPTEFTIFGGQEVFLPTVTGAAGAYVRVTMTYIDAFGNLGVVGGDSHHYIVDTNGGNANLLGTALSEMIFGNGGADIIRAGAGDDFVQGENGQDQFFAQIGDGNDTFDGGNGIDTYNMSETNASTTVDLSLNMATSADTGTDALYNIENVTGSSGANTIVGDAGNNVITGLGGDDLLDGGLLGTDTLNGGLGNDTFIVSHAGVTVVENTALPTGGVDLVLSAISFTLGTNVDNLTLTGGAAINGTGNTLNNIITGNSAANVLNAGTAGTDTLLGGDGNDTYTVDHAGVTVIEAIGEGTDLVNSSVSFVIDQYVENLTLTGTGNINGTGNDLDNVITGNTGANILDGGAAGSDTLAGGTGNDTYVISHAGILISEALTGGTDTVQTAIDFDLSTSGANVENLTLTGAAVLNGTGNSLANVMTGNAAASTLAGGDGNDTYVVTTAGTVVVESSPTGGTDLVQSAVSFTLGANVENLTLTGAANIDGTGNAGVNTITGNTGNNRLDGAGGADSLVGGAGNDTYVINTGTETITDSAGTDTVETSVSYSILAVAAIENLTLTGGAAITGTGNANANIMTGNSAASTLDGGTGNDTYVISNGATVIVETAAGGTDLVQSSATYTLATNVENLTLTGAANIDGTGNAGNNTITGNSGNNRLAGGGGTDTLAGGLGDDTYVVATGVTVNNAGETGGTDLVESSITFSLATLTNVENLTLVAGAGNITATGNTLNNVLTGNEGNNSFTGGGGVDTYIGGDGNDTYNVAVGGTVIIETNAAAAGGVDLVSSSIDWTLGTNLENLTLTGTALVGTGNDLANVITGTTGANTLDGGISGADTLVGLGGNDTYIISHSGMAVTEAAAGGTDLVMASVTVDLSSAAFSTAQIENLTLTGGAAITGTGNSLNNLITGNAAASTLIGLSGNDTYVVTAAGTSVVEGAGAGTDRVISNFDVDLTLLAFANVEEATLAAGVAGALNLTGGTGVNRLEGNEFNNTIVSGGGGDTLIGGAGDDTYVVTVSAPTTITELAGGGTDLVTSTVTLTLAANVENLTLLGAAAINGTGNTGANTITGNGAANILNGGGGAGDVLIGGGGNDTYTVSVVGTVVTETDAVAATGGTDLVNASVDFTLGANVENLTMTAAGLTGTGNELGNLLTFFNGTGTLIGGDGNDTYIVSNALNVVSETNALAAGGIDLVQSSVAYSLGAGSNVENLTLTAAVNGTGNELNNVITGNTGINTLSGGLGNDTLIGGGGADILIGGAGNDTLVMSGLLATFSSDTTRQIAQITDAGDYGDTITNFSANAATPNFDLMRFTGTLNTLFNDRTIDTTVQFVSGSNSAAVNIAANMDTTFEGMYLNGSLANNEGVANANLGNAALVAAAFNAEFAITAAVGEDALLVINDNNANSTSVWQWIQAAGGTGEIDASELTLIGTINANTTTVIGNFDFGP